jgi:hypothetical protein
MKLTAAAKFAFPDLVLGRNQGEILGLQLKAGFDLPQTGTKRTFDGCYRA